MSGWRSKSHWPDIKGENGVSAPLQSWHQYCSLSRCLWITHWEIINRHQPSNISYGLGAGPEQSWVTCLPASVLLFPPQASSRIDCGAGWCLLLWDRDNVKLSPTAPTVKHLRSCCERAFKHPPKPLMPSSHAVAVATQHLLPALPSTSSSFCRSLSIPQRILERKPFNPSKPPDYYL